ncbi:pyruvate ferredoxin oxidoreductase [Candidatus Micrarchaeota archaeon]|nr:pyruvate ferredoxin oxidoreductase [Candidatus Micrarchaeota archaeon]
MKKIMEGSIAVAHVTALCRPGVIAAYPITPSTHIPEELSRIQPQYGYEFVDVESELSAISALIGASAAGSRTFTATSSQGLLLMHEALHNAAGMRLPLVMAVANRAVSAPINIWNDWQDSLSQRDTGWIQLYCKNNQETVDTLIQAFKIAEASLIPTMVCFDGFFLTHEISPLEIPSQEEVDSFLPKFSPASSLDIGNPLTFGAFVSPEHYQGLKEMQQEDLLSSVKTIKEVAAEFEKKFKRKQFPFVEEYCTEDADYLFATMGSLAENAERAVDSLREKKEKVGLLRIKCFRPFPGKEIAGVLEGRKGIAVIEKDLSLGNEGILANEIKAALCGVSEKKKPSLLDVICGLGGKDVPLKVIANLYQDLKKNRCGTIWV